MSYFKKFVTFFALLATSLVALLGIALLTFKIVLVILPQELSSPLEERAYRYFEVYKNWGSRDSEAASSAMQDREAIGRWMTHCWEGAGRLFGEDDPTPDAYQRMVTLGEEIVLARLSIENKITTAYSLHRIGTFAAIIIGALTTIFVGFAAGELGKKDGRVGLTIRTIAVVLPPIGTAIAAVIAFYDPAGTLARQSQLAAGMQQIHAQMVDARWEFGCPGQSNAMPAGLKTKVDAWSQRYSDLILSGGDSRALNVSKEGRANDGGAAPAPGH